MRFAKVTRLLAPPGTSTTSSPVHPLVTKYWSGNTSSNSSCVVMGACSSPDMLMSCSGPTTTQHNDTAMRRTSEQLARWWVVRITRGTGQSATYVVTVTDGVQRLGCQLVHGLQVAFVWALTQQ